MTTICVPCGRVYRPLKIGVRFEERQMLDDWAPYRVWAADLYGCPECGVEILTGLSREPLATAHERHYPESATDLFLAIEDPYGVHP